MSEASPRPWKVYSDTRIIDLNGRFVADVRRDDNTEELRAYIVTAANAFPDLVEACKDALSKIDDCADGRINFRRDFGDRLRTALKTAGATDATH